MEEKKRFDLINHLIKKHELSSYCEIGTQVRASNFDKINCDYKFCVDIDPAANADFTGSSDMFFALNTRLFDIYFLDGLHTAEQVQKDFENALKILSPNGFIVLHDCNPEKEEHTIVPRPTKTGHWNGDVYKFAMQLYLTNKFTVDIDNGCMVIPFCKDFRILRLDYNHWERFIQNRKELLNLISWEKFVKPWD